MEKQLNDELKRLEIIEMNEKADNAVAVAVAATAATGAIPIPFADAPLLIGEQVTPVSYTHLGFSFHNYNAHEMLYMIRYACKIYFGYPEEWEGIIHRGMAMDYSWAASASKYAEIYEGQMCIRDSNRTTPVHSCAHAE